MSSSFLQFKISAPAGHRAQIKSPRPLARGSKSLLLKRYIASFSSHGLDVRRPRGLSLRPSAWSFLRDGARYSM